MNFADQAKGQFQAGLKNTPVIEKPFMIIQRNSLLVYSPQ